MRLLKGDKHRRWQQDLSAYIDGYLEPHKKQALQEHLAECASCQKELETLQGVVALLHRVPQVPVPHSFALSQAPVRRIWWGARYAAPLRYATAAAALLLLAVAVGDLVTGQPSVATPEGPTATERRGEQTPEETPDETTFTTTAPAAEGKAVPEIMPTPQPMAATTPDRVEEVLKETAPAAPMPEEPGNANTLYRRAEVVLGAVLAVLAALAALQWWLTRRRKIGR